MMTFDFLGKTIIITGAASGMGLLSSKNFLELNANVVMVDINEPTINKISEELNEIYPNHVIGMQCDVRDYQQVENVCKVAYEKFNSIDVMLNLAGGAEMRMLNVDYNMEFPDVPIDVFDWGIDVNLKGQLYFDHCVLRYMREQNSGVIINVGSITGQEGCPANIAYSTAKSGVMNGMTKSLALYGAKHNIRVVCIAPGPVLTRPGMASMKTPMGRAAQPQEIVDSIVFMASEHSSFTTGVTFLVDGGRDISRDKNDDD